MRPRCLSALLTTLSVPLLGQQASVLTQHNDLARTGANLTETVLTPSNVNTTTFGKLFSVPVDGPIYGQPLYLPNVAIPGQGTHNIVIVATQHDSVYAFDADASGPPLWKASLLDAAHGAAPGATPEPALDLNDCGDIPLEVGVTGTPVIDPAAGTVYMVAKTNDNGSVVQRLPALSISSGLERASSPVVIQAAVAGVGAGTSGGILTFDPKWSHQRAGLLLFNGYVYIAFASHCDFNSWHGWMIAYNGTTMQQSSALAMTPDGSGSGVWMSGGAPAAETLGPISQIFVSTGNGSFDGNRDFGDDILKITTNNGVMKIADQFTPLDQAALNAVDADLSSGGVLLLPDQTAGGFQHLLVSAGKLGRIYVVNRDNMGAFNPTYNNIVQDMPNALAGLWGTPAYWNNNVYFWGSTYQGGTSAEPLKAFSLSGGHLSTSPVAASSRTSLFPGPGISVSANGNSNGVLWAIIADQYTNGGNAVLIAHDAANVANFLYSSDQNSVRDNAGRAVKFTAPTIANGKVYTGSWSALCIYGLLSGGGGGNTSSLALSTSQFTAAAGSSASAQLTVNGGTPASNFAATGLPAGVTATFSPTSGSGTTVTLTTAPTAIPSTNGITIAATVGSAYLTSPATITVTTGTGGGGGAGTLPYGASVIPASGSAAAATPTTLQFNWASPSGQPALAWGSLVIQDSAASSPAFTSACYMRVFGTGAVQLADDSGSFSFSNDYTGQPYATTQFNTQCQLNGLASSLVQATINGLQVTLNLQFSSAWGGKSLAIWLQGTNTSYQTGTWQQLGTFTVGSSSAPAFTMSASSATAQAGALATSTISIIPANGFHSTVQLAAAFGWPLGISATFGANPATSTSSLSINVASTVAAGSYTLLINGSSGNLNASTTVNLNVTSAAGGGTLPYGVSVTPSSSSANASVPTNLQFTWVSPTGQPGLVWTSVVIQDSANPSPTSTGSCYLRINGTGAVQLGDDTGAFSLGNSYSGLSYATTVANSQCQLNGLASSIVQWLNSGASMQVTLNLQFQPSWNGKTLSIWLQGTNFNYQSGTWSQLGSLAVTSAVPPSFNLSATPATAQAGASASSTIAIAPVNGFNSAVNLNASAWPSGVTGTFGTNPATSTSTASINVSASVAAGSYSLTVTGSSGGLTASTTIFLNVTSTAGGGGGGTLPYGVSVTPASNSVTAGTASNFQFNWASPVGQPGIVWSSVVIQDSATSTATPANSCYLRIHVTGAVQLADDGGGFSNPNNYVGQSYASTQSNSYCQLNGLGSTQVQVANGGSSLQVKLNLQFNSVWSGKSLSIWLQGTNSSYQSGNWTQLGSLTVATGTGGGGGGTLPYGVSVTPATASASVGTPVNLTFAWVSPAGQSPMTWATFVIQDAANPTPTQAGTCYMRVNSSGAVQLADDIGAFTNGNVYVGAPYAPTVSNSHCQLNGAASGEAQVTSGASSIQVTLSIQLTAAWSGANLAVWMQGTNYSYQSGAWAQFGSIAVH